MKLTADASRLNLIYPDEEAALARAALRRAEDTLCYLTLARDKIRLLAEIERYKVILAPHKKLPVEVWLHIFRLCCIGIHPMVPGKRACWRVNVLPAVVLTQVCSAWRRLMLNAPEFWSVVHIEGHRKEDQECIDMLSLAGMWLSRAKDIPRSLDALITPAASESTSRVIDEIVFQFPFRSLHVATLDFPRTAAKSRLTLEMLTIRDTFHHGYRALRLDAFPNLRYLNIHNSGAESISCFDLSAQWHRFLNLELSYLLSATDCATILRMTSNLERCCLRIAHRDPLFMTGGDVLLPRLTTLEIMFDAGGVAEPFLGLLIVPKLKSLRLNYFDHYNDIDDQDRPFDTLNCNTSTFQRMAQRSGLNNIEEVALDRTTSILNVGAFLRCMPSLRCLRLSTRCSLDDATQRQIGTGVLGRHLQILGIHIEEAIVQSVQDEITKILVMLESRRKTVRDQDSKCEAPVSS